MIDGRGFMGNSVRTLLLEDSPSDAELILHELRSSGFEPDWVRVETSSAFLQELKNNPDVILADYSLPQYDVLQALAAVHSSGLDIPLIVVTGAVDESRVVECLRHGASDYLVKDRLSRLGAAVTRALEYRDLQRKERLAQNQLSELSSIMQTVNELAPDAILVADASGIIQHANPQAEKMFGYERGELVGKPVEALVPVELRAQHAQMRSELTGANLVAPMLASDEIAGLRKDGASVPVEFRINARVTPASPAVMILRDVTQRKQAEARIRMQGDLLMQVSDAVYSTDLDGRVTTWNHGAELIYGWKAADAEGKSIREVAGCQNAQAFEQVLENLNGQPFWSGRLERCRKDGSPILVISSISRLTDDKGRTTGCVCVDHDVSDQARIMQISTRYQLLSDQARDIILFIRFSDGHILEANQSAIQAYGYPREEILALTMYDLYPADIWDKLRVQMDQANRGGVLFETVHKRKDGTTFPVEISAHGADLDGERVLFGLIRDISERKRTEETLRAVDEQITTILNSAPVAIVTIDNNGLVTTWTPSAEKMFGWKTAEVIGQRYPLIHADQTAEFDGHLARTLQGESSFYPDAQRVRRDGSMIDVAIRAAPLHDASTAVIGTLIMLEDISELKRSANALEKTNEQLKTLIDESPLAIVALDTDGRVETWNPRAEQIFERPADTAIGCLFADIVPQNPLVFQKSLQKTIHGSNGDVVDFKHKRKDGLLIDLSVHSAELHNAAGEVTGAIGIYEDVTDRRLRERGQEAIARVASALRTADRPTEMFPVILEQVETLLEVHAAAIGLYQPEADHFRVELARGAWADLTGQVAGPSSSLVWSALREGKPFSLDHADLVGDPLLDPSGSIQSILAVPLIARNDVIGAVWAGKNSPLQEQDLALLRAVADISANAIHRAQLYDQTGLAYQRLTILRTIDQAISASMDLRLVLDLLIDQITTQLHMDVAMIYLYSPGVQSLEFAIGRGFPGRGFLKRSFRMGESHIGMVALKREMEYIPDLSKAADDEFTRRMSGFNDHLVTFIAIPLIAKGQVKGVLEIFNRKRIEPDPDWLDFLRALGAQTAIAIDNAELFGQLQRSNTNLTLAYDATIEGWSRALDLRDEETEDHSQRVTNLTLKLATRFGVPLADQVHIRRGALLHDIGKVGVPDTILRKPGPLTTDEWTIMRKHPEYALDLLSPISYLQPAIAIPAFHHERWDGSGYPHKLKGEEIPFAARIFAVVDVWDALISNRCYRPAWKREKALEYIRAESGIQFDPRVVDAFVEIINQEQTTPGNTLERET
jgi:PAS domain S-box-containing protein/putative nucleotidyltransferase with HDIG domain